MWDASQHKNIKKKLIRNTSRITDGILYGDYKGICLVIFIKNYAFLN